MELSGPAMHQPPHRPNVSSASASSTSGWHRLLSRTSLRITGPVILLSAATAVAFAGTNGNGSTQTNLHADTHGTANITVTHDSTQDQTASQPAASADTSSGSDPTSGNNSRVHTDITLNGQHIDVPPNGSVNRTVTSPDGSTSLTVRSTSSGSDYNSTTSSTDVNVTSDSSTSASSMTVQVGTGGNM